VNSWTMVVHIGSDLTRCLKIQASRTTKSMPGWNTIRTPTQILYQIITYLGC